MATSSREARSARREALRKQLQINTANANSKSSTTRSGLRSQSRVAKEAAKVPRANTRAKKAVQTAMRSAMKAARKLPAATETKKAAQIEQASEEITKQPQSIESSISEPVKEESIKEEPVKEEPIVPEQQTEAQEPSEKVEAKENVPSLSNADSAPASPEIPFEPMSPCSPPTEQFASPSLPQVEEMGDDDLQRYLSEFEAASQGQYPDPEPVAATLLSPALEATDKSMGDFNKPMSPLSLEHGDFDFPMDATAAYMEPMPIPMPMMMVKETEDELKIDEYITYNDNTTESSSADYTSFSTPYAPFCIYRPKQQTSPVSTTFNPNKRTLLAALETVAADSQHVSREAYIQSVILAAASLNQRSMITGLARQTMAPALGTSH